MLHTTMGQLAINSILPEDLRDHGRVIDKKSIKLLMQEVATRYPEKYKDITQQLSQLGQATATGHGRSASFGIKDVMPPVGRDVIVNKLRACIHDVVENPKLTTEERNKEIIKLVGAVQGSLRDLNLSEGTETKNPFALQILSGARGNPSQFASLRVGDLLVADHRDEPVPIPMLHSYAEGLDPVEYWAGSYGARKGTMSVQMATPKSGFFGKELALGSHRIIVTEKDCGTTNGLPVDADDPDNEGALLSRSYDTWKQDTPITPEMIKKLTHHKMILVRSPITCDAENGICQKCAGFREHGSLPALGENIGVTAATSVSEPMTQAPISAKHHGGVMGSDKKTTSFDTLKRMVDVPQMFVEASPVAKLDGIVKAVDEAPQGGWYVSVGSERHYIPEDRELLVKPGSSVEAGDALASGVNNPAETVKYKGIGEARRQFVGEFRNLARGLNVSVHRRNLEALSRGMINHVRVTDLDGVEDGLPGDIKEFDSVTRRYEPRFGFKTLAPSQAHNHYLERPVNQYSIGTRITPRVAKDISSLGIKGITVHADPPPFHPEMRRAMETLSYADDWLVRMGGWGLKKGLTDAAQHGSSSNLHGTSFIPALAQGTEFGRVPPGKGY